MLQHNVLLVDRFVMLKHNLRPVYAEPANIRDMHVSVEPQAAKMAARWPIWTLAVILWAPVKTRL